MVARKRVLKGLSVAALLMTGGPVGAQTDGAKVAAMFGARPSASEVSISADGSKIVYIAPSSGPGKAAVVGNLADGTMTPIMRSDGDPFLLTSCGWSGPNRVVCSNHANKMVDGVLTPFTRTVALDSNGGNVVALGRKANRTDVLRMSQFDGAVIDWLAGDDDTILVTQDVVPETQTGTLVGQTRDGLSVVRQNTRTLKAVQVEAPQSTVNEFMSDGRGNIRIKALAPRANTGMQQGKTVYQYRPTGSRAWQ